MAALGRAEIRAFGEAASVGLSGGSVQPAKTLSRALPLFDLSAGDAPLLLIGP